MVVVDDELLVEPDVICARGEKRSVRRRTIRTLVTSGVVVSSSIVVIEGVVYMECRKTKKDVKRRVVNRRDGVPFEIRFN